MTVLSAGQGELDEVEELGRIVTAVRCNEVKRRGYPFDSLRIGPVVPRAGHGAVLQARPEPLGLATT